MGQPGIGAMIHYLSGGSQNDPNKYVGREIAKVAIADDRLAIDFADGSKIDVWDNRQSCCESRYMTTDDDVASIVGGKLLHITSKDGPNMDGGEEHETCFVEIATDKGFITVTNHNEHNGYYGGFGLTITER